MVKSNRNCLLINLQALSTFLLIMSSSLKKTMYDLQQAPRAWYDRMS